MSLEEHQLKLDQFISIIQNRSWAVIVVALLVMLVLSAGARNLVITNDYRILFKDDNPELLAFDTLKSVYAVSDHALIAIAPEDGAIFSQKALRAIEEMTEAAWLTPYATRVDSLTNYAHSEASDDDLVVGPLVKDAHTLSDDELNRIQSIALNDIEIVGRLVSHPGHVGGLAITFAMPDNFDAGVAEVNASLNGMLDEFRASYPDIAFHLTGNVVINSVFTIATQEDLRKLSPIVFFVIVAFSIFLLRSISGTIAIVLVLLFAVSSTLGVAGWTGAILSPTNSGLPLIVSVITVAHAVHIVSNTILGMKNGLDKRSAVADSMRINFYPVCLTSLTTSIGFLSLNASESPPFHVLGNFVAFGVLCAFIYSVILLPALLCVMPLRLRASRTERHSIIESIADFVIARQRILLWSFVVVTVVLIVGIPRNELTDNWTKYFDERYEFRQDTDFIIDNLTGMETLEYSLVSGRKNGITDPEYLRTVDAFAEWFRQQPEVKNVQAFSDVMKRLNKNMNNDQSEFYRLPDNPELAAQYLLLFEFSLPFGSDLNNRIDIDKSSTRMTVALENLTSRGQRELDERAQAWMAENAPGLSGPATGFSIIIAHLSEKNIYGMLRGTIIAMLLISLILIGVFRSLRIGLISLIPNFIPAAMSFGIWGYLVGSVGMAASVVTAIAFGIVVDDTIHFLTKYLRYHREGSSAVAAIRSTFRTVGHALWSTTLILAAGFLVFATSGFEISWALGWLVAITLLMALATDFLLLPPLLLALNRTKT